MRVTEMIEVETTATAREMVKDCERMWKEDEKDGQSV